MIFDLDPAPRSFVWRFETGRPGPSTAPAEKGTRIVAQMYRRKRPPRHRPIGGQGFLVDSKTFCRGRGGRDRCRRTRSLRRDNEQGQTNGQDLHRLFPKRLLGDGDCRLCGARASGCAGCPANRLERVEGSGIGQSIYDERRPDTIEAKEGDSSAFAPNHSCGLKPMPSANAPHHSPAVLILIDVINHFEFPDGEKVLRQALPIAPRVALLKKRAQAAGISTIYVNDNFGQWRDRRFKTYGLLRQARSDWESVCRADPAR